MWVLPEAFVGPLDPKPGECSGTPEFESTVYLREVEHHPIRDLLHIAQVLGCPHKGYCDPVLTVITPLGVFAGAGRSTSVHMDEIVSLDPLYSVTAPPCRKPLRQEPERVGYDPATLGSSPSKVELARSSASRGYSWQVLRRLTWSL